MGKAIKHMIFILLSLILIACGQVSEYQAREVLQKHLQQRYGEPFEIEYMGIRGTDKKEWYQVEIYPSRYKGTPKEYDDYYRSVGTVRIHKNFLGMEKLGTGGDVYFSVRVNESAAAFFKPKLDELFGNMYLPVFQIRGWQVKENGDFIKTLNHHKENDHSLYMEGGIYIFGRVENESDREWYRTQIYEFVRFMKETGTFEHVNLAFYILDERCLADGFVEDVGNKLMEARNELKAADEFLEYRAKLLNTLNEEYKNLSEYKKIEKINSYNRNFIRDIWKHDNSYSVLYHTVIQSRKFLETETRLSKYKKLDYLKKEEVKLLNTVKIVYKEYDIEELYKNEWGD
jgi:hypothetical protein